MKKSAATSIELVNREEKEIDGSGRDDKPRINGGEATSGEAIKLEVRRRIVFILAENFAKTSRDAATAYTAAVHDAANYDETLKNHTAFLQERADELVYKRLIVHCPQAPVS